MLLKNCVAFIVVVMGFSMSAAADDVQNATVVKGGIAVNANNGAQVYLDASKRIYQLNDKEDLRKIVLLETERKNLLTEISRLSLVGEDQIIRRSQQELVNSLPTDLKEKYTSGDWRSVVEYLELSKKGLEKKAEKVNQALSKTEFELAFLYADTEPSVALEHLSEALKLNPQNLPAAALSIQLLIGLGRSEGVIDLLGALSNRTWFSSAGKDSLEEVEQLILGSYIHSVMALIDSGRSDLVVETIRRGLEFSDSAVGLSSRGRSDLRLTLEFYSRLLDGKRNVLESMSFDSIKAALDGVDHSFDNCRNCWNFIGVVATHNLVLVPISTLMGRKDFAISASKRAQSILSDKNLPAPMWYRLRYIELLGMASVSSIYGDQKSQEEYYEKAIEHLKRGLANGAFSVDRYLELARREIERTTFLPSTKTDLDVKQKLASVSRIISDSVGRTKGFEYEHADIYVALSQAYLKAGLGKDSELILQKADDVLSKLSAHSGSVRFLESRGRFLEAQGYQKYYRGDFSGAQEIVRVWGENVKLRYDKGLFVDLSAPIELKARVVLLSGGCEKFEVAVLEALDVVTAKLAANKNSLLWFARKQSLLKLLTFCSKFDRVAWERYLELFAYTDVLFQERPWDAELADELIDVIHNLSISDFAIRRGEGFYYYSELLRNRMLQCGEYRATAAKCSSHAAFALAILGNNRIETDPLLVDKSIQEFRRIEKNGWLDTQSKKVYMTVLTLYAGALHWEQDNKRYLDLQREVLRVYELIPDKERPDAMRRWADSLQRWLTSNPSSKYGEKSWWLFGGRTQ